MEKDFETVLLLDAYAGLLTVKQQRLCDMYYNQDYSLAEIAQIERTTRQAVRDGIGKARQKLLGFEKCLSVVAMRQQTLAAIEQAGAASPGLDKLKNTLLDIWERDNGI